MILHFQNAILASLFFLAVKMISYLNRRLSDLLSYQGFVLRLCGAAKVILALVGDLHTQWKLPCAHMSLPPSWEVGLSQAVRAVEEFFVYQFQGCETSHGLASCKLVTATKCWLTLTASL